jgi:tryptophanyl-tRNA synthetase
VNTVAIALPFCDFVNSEFTNMTEPEPPAVAALSLAETATLPVSKATEQEINPWDVQAATDEQGNVLAFDYKAISEKWNTKLIDEALLQRFERVTGQKPHRWLRRGLFFSHRDLDLILDHYERGETFILYTGRGPSSDSMHIGHTIPFEFTKWLQDVFDVPLVIMLTDDEKVPIPPPLPYLAAHTPYSSSSKRS